MYEDDDNLNATQLHVEANNRESPNEINRRVSPNGLNNGALPNELNNGILTDEVTDGEVIDNIVTDEADNSINPLLNTVDILPFNSENNWSANPFTPYHFDISDQISNLHLVELPDVIPQTSIQNNGAGYFQQLQCSKQSDVKTKYGNWVDNQEQCKQYSGNDLCKKTSGNYQCKQTLGNDKCKQTSGNDQCKQTSGNDQCQQSPGNDHNTHSSRVVELCNCEKTVDDLSICSRCFLLHNRSLGKLCHCDNSGEKKNKTKTLCSNCEYLQESIMHGNVCQCVVTTDETICANCFNVKNFHSGGKRKSDQPCYPLHMELNESEELLEESSSWISQNYCLKKKARIPHTGMLFEPLPEEVSVAGSFFTGRGECGEMTSLGERIGLKLDQIESVLDEMEDVDEVIKLKVQVQDMRLIDIVETPSDSTTTTAYSFFLLPSEIQLKIFSYFTQRELCRYVVPICSAWFHLSKDVTFWQHLSATREYDDVSSDLLVRVILSWCTNLTKLELNRRHDITVVEFREIFQNCRNIRQLSLAFCAQVDDEILGLVGTYCKCLSNINFEGCSGITDTSFYHFVGLPLTHVSVSHCNMLSDDGGVFLVRNFKNLVEINFDGIQWMSEEFVDVLVTNHYKTLQKVFLDGENLGDDVVRQISRCTHLRALSFSFCNLMSHDAVEWVGQCTKINHLQLRKGSNFTNASILGYVQNMNTQQGLQFRYLNLAECSEISDKCLFYLSEKCQRLKILDLSWCWEVSDDGLQHIVDNCNQLEQLHLKGLHELYGTPFFHLPQTIPTLTFLDLSQCNKIQDQLIENIVEKMKDLIVYNYYGDTVVNARHREAHRYINM